MQKTQMLIQEVEKIEEASPFYIRIVDVLKELQPYEVTDLEILTDDEEVDEAESVDKYLDYLDALFGLKEVVVNNSYNWNAPVDNHFNYHIYEDQINNRYLVKFSVHRYGDVRANYTDSVLYSFDHIDDFFAVVSQAGYYKPIGKYYLEACPLQEGWRLYNEEGEEVAQLFDEHDVTSVVHTRTFLYGKTS